jgi:hypothetical protein
MAKPSTKKVKKSALHDNLSAKALRTSAIDSWPDADLSHLSKTQSAQVFISSLNGYPLKLSSEDTSILSDFRKYLTRQIDKTFRFLSAQINEDWPATGAGNPKETTEYLARTCHIFIGILVDSYGFTDETGLSATVVELDAAYQDSPEKMLIFIQHTLRDTTSEIYQKLPKPYQTWLTATKLSEWQGRKILQYLGRTAGSRSVIA